MNTMKNPTIAQYLISDCLIIIKRFNAKYGSLSKTQLKEIADTEYNEWDIMSRIGSQFEDMVHYGAGSSSIVINGANKNQYKSNHDMFIEDLNFLIEVKYLKNWKSQSGNHSSSKNWVEFQQDFDWLINEIQLGNKFMRAFIIGWFNCVDTIAQYIQLGEGSGCRPLLSEKKFAYFPFERKMKTPTRTSDIQYNYELAYKELSLNLIGDKDSNCNCLFLGKPTDVFHFAIYY